MQNHDHDHGQSAGNLKISRDVLATIARYATMEIEGVASLASFTTNIRGWLLIKQSAKPITIDLNDDIAAIDIHVNIKAGVNIPQTAEKIQSAVKEAVQNMTGIAVSRVNINIAEIVFDDPSPAADA